MAPKRIASSQSFNNSARAASISAMASATRTCTVGSSDIFTPPTESALCIFSTMISSAPRAMPSAGPENTLVPTDQGGTL